MIHVTNDPPSILRLGMPNRAAAALYASGLSVDSGLGKPKNIAKTAALIRKQMRNKIACDDGPDNLGSAQE
jgi:hypothetical protein